MSRKILSLLTIAVIGTVFGCDKNSDKSAKGETIQSEGIEAPVSPQPVSTKPAPAKKAPMNIQPKDILRMTPAEVHPLVASGDALLVCAYDSDEKFDSLRLEGAISFSKFEKELPSLSKDKRLIFYCA